jgi:hypothetical protein
VKVFLGLANASKNYRSANLKIDTEIIGELLAAGTLDGLDTAESYDNFHLLKDIGIKEPNLDLTSKIGLKPYMSSSSLQDSILTMSDVYKIKNGFNLLIHDSTLDKIYQWGKFRDVLEVMLDQKIIRSFGLSAYLPYEVDFFRRIFPFASIFQIPRNLFTQKLDFRNDVEKNSLNEPVNYYIRSIFAGGNFSHIQKILEGDLSSSISPMVEQTLSKEDTLLEISANYQRRFPDSNLVIGANNVNQIIQTANLLRQDRHHEFSHIENVLSSYSGILADLRRVG